MSLSLVIRFLFRRTALFLFVTGWLLLASCANKVDRNVIDEDRMTDILYDYHLSMAMLERVTPDSSSYYGLLYEKAVLTKHKISKEQFDYSLRWYEKNPDRLCKIYEELSERFNVQTNSLGNADSPKRVWTSEGDTANVWNSVESVLLSASGNNRFTFVLPADSSYHGGDRFEWIFDVNWLYQEGRKQAFAVMCLTYDNDSIATVSMPVFTSGRQMLSAYAHRNKQLKQISGFIFQVAPWHQRPRLMSITELALMRYHVPMPKVIASESIIVGDRNSADSLRIPNPEQRIRDSLLKADRHERDHFKDATPVEGRVPMMRMNRRAESRR